MHHPNPETLHEYVIGKLPVELADEVEQHLTVCASCGGTVDHAELPREADSFVNILLSPGEPDPYEDDPSFQKMLSNVERLLSVGGEVTSDSRIATPSAFIPEQSPPGRLGEYELGESLGSGGMGAVYRGFHRKLRRPVAIKLLKSDRVQDAAAVDRFEREMEAVGRLEHTHIVRALDAGDTDGTLYLVMELADGLSLADVSARLGTFSVANACEAVRQAALGIAAAHRAGMTHRDVKPGNLILARIPSDDGTPMAVVKVLDLGLARFHESNEPEGGELTTDGQVMGTVDYMAPEQAVSSRDVGPKADVYALGATLYRLMTGRSPLDVDGKATLVQRLAALTSKPAPPVASLRPDLPRALAKLIDRTLSRDADARPTVAEFAKELQRFASGADLFALLATSEVAAAKTPESLIGTATSMPGVIDTKGGSFIALPAPAVKPAKVPPRRYVRLGALAAAGALLPILLGVIFLLQTPKGTIRVEIEDPNVEVRVKDGEALLSGPGQEETRVAVGDHGLVVTRGDLSFETKKFDVRRGQTVVVKVELIDGAVLATADGTVIGRRQVPDEPGADASMRSVAPIALADASGDESPSPGAMSTPTEAGCPSTTGTTNDERFVVRLRSSKIEPTIDIPVEPDQPITFEAFLRTTKVIDPARTVWVCGLEDTLNLRIVPSNQRHTWQAAVWDPNGTGTFSHSDSPVREGERTHVAACWDGRTLSLFIDGKKQHDAKPLDRFPCSDRARSLGACDFKLMNAGTIEFSGVRISKIARYAQSFEPPQRFVPDDDTIVLYQMDEGSGDVLHDSSGNERHLRDDRIQWAKADSSKSGP